MDDLNQRLIGKRVSIHPACDYWMRGATHGTIVEVKTGLAKAKVRLSNIAGAITDANGKPLEPVWLTFNNLIDGWK